MIRRVKGQSMIPFLMELDEVISGEINPFECSSGDIVIYAPAVSGKCLAVHRVLSVDKKNNIFFIKGDNAPNESIEKVPFSSVKEKVFQIKRSGRVIDLNRFPRNVTKKIIAFTSGIDLTPKRFKARFIDPVALAIADRKLFKILRESFYKDISFSVSKNKDMRNVYGFVKGSQSAKAELDHKSSQKVVVTSYIRRRDRNPFFAEKFLSKIIEVICQEFGEGKTIYVTDQELKKLIASKEKFCFDEKIIFVCCNPGDRPDL